MPQILPLSPLQFGAPNHAPVSLECDRCEVSTRFLTHYSDTASFPSQVGRYLVVSTSSILTGGLEWFGRKSRSPAPGVRTPPTPVGAPCLFVNLLVKNLPRNAPRGNMANKRRIHETVRCIIRRFWRHPALS